jgi:hypothetical protein
VAGEDHAHAGGASGFEDLRDPGCNVGAVCDLLDDSDLHVIDDEGHASWITNVLQGLRNLESECAVHEKDSNEKSEMIFGEKVDRARVLGGAEAAEPVRHFARD